MARKRASAPAKKSAGSSLMVRLDEATKACLVEAAKLRGISVSDYVRTVMVPQARREIHAAKSQTVALTPDEQFAFWTALQAPPKLTTAQKRLASVMRGEA